MSGNRWTDVRVERAAVLAAERSILDLTDRIVAHPVSDFGIDLIAFAPDPFRAAPIQVKGAQKGLRVTRQYVDTPIVMCFVMEPLDAAPLVSIMTGTEAWQLPSEYIRRGGRASDHRDDNGSYRWASIPRMLRTILREREATESRWAEMLHRVDASSSPLRELQRSGPGS